MWRLVKAVHFDDVAFFNTQKITNDAGVCFVDGRDGPLLHPHTAHKLLIAVLPRDGRRAPAPHDSRGQDALQTNKPPRLEPST